MGAGFGGGCGAYSSPTGSSPHSLCLDIVVSTVTVDATW